MNTDRKLVLIGEDKTDQVNTWSYNDGKICVTFSIRKS